MSVDGVADLGALDDESDADVSAVTDGKLIDRGTKVVVKEVRGNRVLVDLADYQTD